MLSVDGMDFAGNTSKRKGTADHLKAIASVTNSRIGREGLPAVRAQADILKVCAHKDQTRLSSCAGCADSGSHRLFDPRPNCPQDPAGTDRL